MIYAYQIVHDREEAEDLVQEAFAFIQNRKVRFLSPRHGFIKLYGTSVFLSLEKITVCKKPPMKSRWIFSIQSTAQQRTVWFQIWKK